MSHQPIKLKTQQFYVKCNAKHHTLFEIPYFMLTKAHGSILGKIHVCQANSKKPYLTYLIDGEIRASLVGLTM
jgi:hypothetical protein